MTLLPAALVPAPVGQSHAFGLFSAALPIEESPHRWVGGITWEDLAVEASTVITHDDCDLGEHSATFPGNNIREGLRPFTVINGFECLAPGSPNAEQRALLALYWAEEAAVEKYLWESFTTTPFPENGKLQLRAAIHRLEFEGLALTGERPTFHLNRRDASYLLEKGVLKTTGTRLHTALGSPVVAGRGYPLEKKIGVTSPLTIYRGEAVPAGSFTRDNNKLTYMASRDYVLGYTAGGVFTYTEEV